MPRERGGKSSPSLAVLSEGFSGNTEAERRIENIHDDRRREESFPYEIYIGKNNPTKIVALMDTGATGLCYIDPYVAEQLSAKYEVALSTLPKPLPLKGFDGKDATPLTKVLYLPMQVGKHYEKMATFYVTKIARHAVIIGKGWMKQHGVLLDCTQNGVYFIENHCQHEGSESRTQMPRHVSSPNQVQLKDGIAIVPTGQQTTIPSNAESLPKKPVVLMDPEVTRNQQPMESPELPKKILVRPSRDLRRPGMQAFKPVQQPLAQSICMINGPAFRTAARQEGSEIFSITMREIEQQEKKDQDTKDAARDLKKLVPEEYHDFLDVFSPEKAKELPPHREKWDHRIRLKEGAQLPRTESLRRLAPDELTALKDYITENLNRAWITPSTSEYASPVLFVKKPNGGIRFCVDYRGLNNVTKKNQYPLPLIDETIAKVVKAKIFTKFDIIQAFHRIRMATEEDEELSTFTCRFGTYKYRVLPFGLSGGPSTYQQFMNDNFLDFEAFVSCYIDDLIVFSNSVKEHKAHVRLVLERLRRMGIQVDILKTEFFTTEVRYLGLIITTNGVKMDPRKVEIIKNWPKPKNGGDTRAIRRFIGFVNFYRRFILSFSKICRPLINLLKKESPAVWDASCDEAFERIQKEVSKEPTMAHFEASKESFVECDASDAAVGGILSQLNVQGDLQPVAFFSKSLGPAERNYAIYDKEMLAIIRCFEEWKPELMSAGPDTPIQVLTDHKSLEYFMSTKQLTRRQARWAELLSQYNFKITFRPGAKNGKADLLTRHVHEDEVSRAKLDPHLQQVLLKPENISQEVKDDVGMVVATFEAPSQTLEEYVQEANRASARFEEIRQELATPTGKDKLHGYKLELCAEREGLVFYESKLLVPESGLTRVISVIHSGREVGHAGVAKTIKAIEATYAFTHMERLVRQYCRNCQDCLRAKPVLRAPAGLLQPLPIPEMPWMDISVDFVVFLPPTKRKNNAMMVVVDRLSKERHYIPCSAGNEEKGMSAEATAQMFYTYVWRLHGLPATIVSDRGSQFVNRFWEHLCEILQIKAKLSTAWHPESDGQTEIANKEMERYLRTFVTYYQDDWDTLSPSAEFAINASVSESTKMSPFMATRGFQPRMSFNSEKLAQEPKTARERLAFGPAKAIALPMKDIWDWTKAWMAASQAKQKHYADQHRRDEPTIAVGDLVWLSMKNIKTERPCKKFDSKWEGPFEVLEKVGSVSFKLKLPVSMHIHPVFHQSLIAKHANDPLPGQEYPMPGPIRVEEEDEWEVEEILDVKKSRGRGGKVLVRASWVGHPPDLTYYSSENFEKSPEYLHEYYERNPTKPKPIWLKPLPEEEENATD